MPQLSYVPPDCKHRGVGQGGTGARWDKFTYFPLPEKMQRGVGTVSGWCNRPGYGEVAQQK